eukprot:jgi/Botrbrau1/9490/Bobra.0252s0105.1
MINRQWMTKAGGGLPEEGSGSPFFIAVHCGAGRHSHERASEYRAVMRRACERGAAFLQAGDTTFRPLQEATAVLEDYPNFNAGRGSNLTERGAVECDASCMAGDAAFGAVGAMPGIRNPIAAAVAIAEEGRVPGVCGRVRPMMLVGEKARDWALDRGIQGPSLPQDLVTGAAQAAWRRYTDMVKTAEGGAPAGVQPEGAQKPVHHPSEEPTPRLGRSLRVPSTGQADKVSKQGQQTSYTTGRDTDQQVPLESLRELGWNNAPNAATVSQGQQMLRSGTEGAGTSGYARQGQKAEDPEGPHTGPVLVGDLAYGDLLRIDTLDGLMDCGPPCGALRESAPTTTDPRRDAGDAGPPSGSFTIVRDVAREGPLRIVAGPMKPASWIVVCLVKLALCIMMCPLEPASRIMVCPVSLAEWIMGCAVGSAEWIMICPVGPAN